MVSRLSLAAVKRGRLAFGTGPGYKAIPGLVDLGGRACARHFGMVRPAGRRFGGDAMTMLDRIGDMPCAVRVALEALSARALLPRPLGFCLTGLFDVPAIIKGVIYNSAQKCPNNG